MNNCIKKVVKIKHHGRVVYGVFYMPENEEKCPVVIFSHGYNGTNDSFAMYGDKDEIVPIEYAKKAAKLYPHAKFEVFSGEGHGFSEAGNKKVAEMTYEFVKVNN